MSTAKNKSKKSVDPKEVKEQLEEAFAAHQELGFVIAMKGVAQFAADRARGFSDKLPSQWEAGYLQAMADLAAFAQLKPNRLEASTGRIRKIH